MNNKVSGVTIQAAVQNNNGQIYLDLQVKNETTSHLGVFYYFTRNFN